jgi:chromosomal replication initiation ATPase DnaA
VIPSQAALSFPPLEPENASNFLSFASNRIAQALLDDPASWPQSTLLLTGEVASGKSHLARLWAERFGALCPASITAGSSVLNARTAPLVVDPVDASVSDRVLFQLLEQSRLGEAGPLLLIARNTPVHWPIGLGDLRSRLAAIGHASIGSADDQELTALFHEFLRRWGVGRDDRLATYVLARIDRTRAALYEFTARLNHCAYERNCRVSLSLASELIHD